jgi:hypothetical protein
VSSIKRRGLPTLLATKAAEDIVVRRTSDKFVTNNVRNYRTWSDPLYWERLQGMQETVSENHPDWRAAKAAGQADVGGDFTSTKTYAQSFDRLVSYTLPWRDGDLLFGNSGRESQLTYRGPIAIPWNHSWTFPPFAGSSEIDLVFWGTKAVALTEPTNAIANTAVALLEAWKDGLPHLLGSSFWKDRTNLARQAGDEYLNVEFGWLPLAGDIRDFVKGVTNFDKLINQFMRDSGMGVRRKHSFSPVISFDESTVATQQWVGGPGNVDLRLLYGNGSVVTGHTGQVIRSRETSVQRWFSGEFVYHAPREMFIPYQYEDFLSKARTILGLDLDPNVVWSLTPWSWAVDWFTTAGDIVHNLNAHSKYGLVLRYGYIMEHSIVRDTYTYVGDLGLPDGVQVPGGPPSIVLTSEKKVRRRASPYGFGISMGTLNDTQKSIIAALGLSRLR